MKVACHWSISGLLGRNTYFTIFSYLGCAQPSLQLLHLLRKDQINSFSFVSGGSPVPAGLTGPLCQYH